MDVDEFFAEAKRLNLRVLGSPDEIRAALDTKDAEIAKLREQLAKAGAAFEREQDRADAAEKNAERYRWLRDNGTSEWGICVWGDDDQEWAQDMRAADVVDREIDAAMALHNAKLKGGQDHE